MQSLRLAVINIVLQLLAPFVLADSTWTFTLPATSPAIRYTPLGAGADARRDPSKSWVIGTDKLGLGTADTTSGTTANGQTYYTTSVSGASFTLAFYGTGIALFGTSNATYAVSMDNEPVHFVKTRDTLLQQDELQLRDHFLTFTVGNDASASKMVQFEYAVVSTSSPSALESTMLSIDASEVALNGAWTPKSIPEVPKYVSTTEYMAGITLTVSNARAIAVHAFLTYGSYLYGVELDGEQVFPPSLSTTPGNQTNFDGTSFWLVPDTVLYFKDDLDTSKQHTLRLTNLGDRPDWYAFRVTSFEVWHVAGATTGSSNTTSQSRDPAPQDVSTVKSSGLSSGTIAGIVISIILGLILATLAILYLIRRRRNTQQVPHFDVDEARLYTVSYAPSSTQPDWSSGYGPGLQSPEGVGASPGRLLAAGPAAMHDRKHRHVVVPRTESVVSGARRSTTQSGSSYAADPTSDTTTSPVPAGPSGNSFDPPPSYQIQTHS
ncbi:hypothetical protein BKA62DRAFT_700059 [Auriculariales sp. MPI-PUGE-AT-0066]|nr:hypothetical protein BKA62DRAFT_700059 [Auriculariales sp. MPI-PUGE-AT-0066]